MSYKNLFTDKKARFSLIYGIAFFRQQMLLLPVLLLFYLSNGLTVGDYFLFQGIMTLLTVLLEMPAGYSADRFSPKIVLVFAFLMLFLRDLFWLFGQGYFVVLFGEFCYTLFRVCFDSVASSYIYTELKKENKTKNINQVYSVFNAVMCLSTAAAALYGSYIYQAAGYKLVLSIELVFIFMAVLSAAFLPANPIKRTALITKKQRYHQMFQIAKSVFKRKSLIPFVLFSGVLVAFSNFFFWSFQPLLKFFESPVMVFGFVVLINNVIRFAGSLFAGKIHDIFGIKRIACIVYILEAIALLFILPLCFYHHLWLCLFLILYLCVCIGSQLVFTINHISRLHKIVLSPIRSSMSSFNMVVSRLITAVLMISAKFLLGHYSIVLILSGYVVLILIPVGGYCLKSIIHQEL